MEKDGELEVFRNLTSYVGGSPPFEFGILTVIEGGEPQYFGTCKISQPHLEYIILILILNLNFIDLGRHGGGARHGYILPPGSTIVRYLGMYLTHQLCRGTYPTTTTRNRDTPWARPSKSEIARTKIIIINSCFRPCSVPLFGSMRANFYLQGKTLKGKKTYMVAESQNQLYMPSGCLLIRIVIRKLPPRDASQVLYVYWT